jgi:hypothetical protein
VLVVNEIKLTVTCYSGHKANERPTGFMLGNKRFGIAEIIDRWYGPDHLYFKIRADDGNIYILKHDEIQDQWDLEYYRKQTEKSKADESY